MLDLTGTQIGGWQSRGCVFVNLVKTNQPDGDVIWNGDLIITQGGDGDYGQVTPVTVTFNGQNYRVDRIIDGGIVQASVMAGEIPVILGGTRYIEISGTITGPGTGGGDKGQIRVRAPAG